MKKYTRKNRTRNRNSIIWPLILILVGVLYLMANLGVIDPIATQSLWRLWPLLFFAFGLDALFRRYEIAGPVFMFTLGFVFLVNNFGWLAGPAWDTLWRLWPVMVIAIGVDIMIGRRTLWLSALGLLAVLVLLVGLVWLMGDGLTVFSGQPIPDENISQPVGSAQNARISLAPATGQVSVVAASDDALLLSGAINYATENDVRSDYHQQGDTAVYELKSHSTAIMPGSRRGWDLAINAQIPTQLEVSMGAGEVELDLTGTQVTALDASQGVGNLAVTLPAGVAMQADVSQAIGQISIQVPAEAALRVEVSKAISSLNIPPNFERRGDYYYSPGYETADERLELSLSQAIGNISIAIVP